MTGMMQRSDLDLFGFADTPEEAWENFWPAASKSRNERI